MLFRLWFYLCKLGICGFVCLFVGLAHILPADQGKLLSTVGIWIVVPIGIGGAVLAVPLLLGWKTGCPFCGGRCKWVTYGKEMALDCPRCGLVHADPIRHWRLRVEPRDADEQSE
jgi:hypothetical protein